MPKEPKRRNHSVGQSLKCQPPKRRRTNRAMENLEHTTERSARAERNNLHEQTHFNDLNVHCIEHIFSFLTIKDKLNFSRVCSTWKTMFKQFWKIVDLSVFRDILGEPSSKKDTGIEMADFLKLFKIGGRHLKSLDIFAYYHYTATNCLRGCINAEEYVIVGQFYICDILKVIANVSTNIQNFVCEIKYFRWLDSAQDISSFTLAAISQLIGKNRKMKCFKMNIDHPLTENFKLKDLPESIEDFEIKFFVEDTSVICDWLSVAKNLRALSFNRYYGFSLPSDITSKIIKCVTYDHTINIKVLRLDVSESPTLVYDDIQRLAVMKGLEELKIAFPDGLNVQIDDFLSAISSGCKNLKKLDLHNHCYITCKGMNPILSKLDLTHLRLRDCCLKLNTLLVRQTTLRSLRLINLKMDSSGVTKLLRTFKELQFIEIYDLDEMAEEHIYELCAACPRLEHVDLTSFSFKMTDQDIYHLLTTLPNLTSAKLDVRGAENIIPLHVDNVNSNIRNLTWADLAEEHNLVQLTKLHNLRSLTLAFPDRHLKKAEMEAICSGFEKLEEIHFRQCTFRSVEMNEKVLKDLKSLLLAKPSLRLATIKIKPAFIGRIVDTIILKKQDGMILTSNKIDQSSCPDSLPI